LIREKKGSVHLKARKGKKRKKEGKTGGTRRLSNSYIAGRKRR